MLAHERGGPGPDAVRSTDSTGDPVAPATLGGLWRQFLPLSVTDVTMMLSDPLITTTLAHLPAAPANLATVGVAKALANFFESPILMMLHASNVLAGSMSSRRALWRFMLWTIAGLTILTGIVTLPGIFSAIAGRMFGLDPGLTEVTRQVLFCLILWPAAIGWRRYFQGLLIHAGHPGEVARAGLGRLSIVVLLLTIGWSAGVAGHLLAGVTMIAGALFEALLVTLSACRYRVWDLPAPATSERLPRDLKGTWSFYWPLGMSTMIVWGGRVLLVALIASAADGTYALAIWTASWALVLLVTNATRMVQQVIIKNRDRTSEGLLFGFALSVGLFFSGLLSLLVLGPGGKQLVESFLGGDALLVAGSTSVLVPCLLMPLLVSLQNGAQGLLIHQGQTRRMSSGTVLGTILLLGITLAGIEGGLPGAAAAGLAMPVSLTLEVLWLARGLAPSRGNEVHL